MRKIYLSAGHSNTKGRDRGAVANGYYEGDLMVIFREKVAYYLLKKYNIKAVLDGSDTILAESLNFFKKITDSTCILVDFHLNSFNNVSKGVETLIPTNYSQFELKLAGNISDVVAKSLDTVLRGSTKGVAGVKTEAESQHKSLGWMRLVGENVLSELCFISNPTEIKRFIDRMDLVSELVADELALASVDWNKSQLKQNSNTIVQNLDGKIYHTVVIGDTLSKLSIKYGTTVLELMKLNSKDGSTVIKIGEKLRVK